MTKTHCREPNEMSGFQDLFNYPIVLADTEFKVASARDLKIYTRCGFHRRNLHLVMLVQRFITGYLRRRDAMRKFVKCICTMSKDHKHGLEPLTDNSGCDE